MNLTRNHRLLKKLEMQSRIDLKKLLKLKYLKKNDLKDKIIFLNTKRRRVTGQRDGGLTGLLLDKLILSKAIFSFLHVIEKKNQKKDKK